MQGGYKCQGKISSIACYVDAHGMVAGLAYENEYDGGATRVGTLSALNS
jgi:hypothetical protein